MVGSRNLKRGVQEMLQVLHEDCALSPSCGKAMPWQQQPGTFWSPINGDPYPVTEPRRKRERWRGRSQSGSKERE